MAKDPALLFYTSDFLVGISMMKDDEVGRYIKLLCLQHQRGRFSKEQFFKVANEEDLEILSKFQIDESGLYFNTRLEEEAEKRRKYSESRSKNRKGNICKTYDPHMENENEDEDINTKEKQKKKKYGEYGNVLLTDAQHSRLVTEWGAGEATRMIKNLDEGIQLKGYKYKDHNLAIRKWKAREVEVARGPTPPPEPQRQGRCYVCKTEGLVRNNLCDKCEKEKNNVS